MTTIQPVMDYGLTVWCAASSVLIQKIQRFQNRAARFITSNFNYEIPGTEPTGQAPSYVCNPSLRSEMPN